MSYIRNQIQLIGNLGQDPELKTFESGVQAANSTIATNEYYKNNKGEKVQDTQWHNLIAWGKTAELMTSLLSKGDEVALQGRLVHKKYEDKSGQTKYIAQIVVRDFVKLGRKSDS